MQMRYLKNVTTLALDISKCTGCGMCAEVCPHAVFRIEGRKAVIEDRDACMECGACARNCAPGALSVRAGVGCAAAVIAGKLRGTENPACGCSGTGCCENG
ncbi:MAG TPA: 4Fe-4S dicluster domain-containing protein [bacterium]|nr:4Fe-4S dicluster domain-containing protein [bacterium]